MASKLTVFATLFVCFLVVADASLRLTTTVVEDEENPQQRRQSQQCQQQVRRQRIQSCQDYIIQQQRGSGRWEDDNDLDVEDEMNPQIRGQGYLNECCQQLQQIDTQCRCQALQEIARQAQQEQQQEGSRYRGQQQGGRYRGGQQQRIQQQVRQLPQICRIQVPQQCQQGY